MTQVPNRQAPCLEGTGNVDGAAMMFLSLDGHVADLNDGVAEAIEVPGPFTAGLT